MCFDNRNGSNYRPRSSNNVNNDRNNDQRATTNTSNMRRETHHVENNNPPNTSSFPSNPESHHFDSIPVDIVPTDDTTWHNDVFLFDAETEPAIDNDSDSWRMDIPLPHRRKTHHFQWLI